MNERELLELAAKAAGIIVDFRGSNPFRWDNGGTSTLWNPLTDDGDAFRLAVKLNMDVNINSSGIVHTYCSFTQPTIRERFNNDSYAATRRAIVRAAAEIGKEMK